MISKFVATTFAGLVLLAGPSAALDARSRIHVTLPSAIEWELATDQSDDTRYLKEWIPKGSSFDTAKWLIVEQKLVLPKKVSAKNYLLTIFSGARAACSHVLFNGPEPLNLQNMEGVAGRFMCARQNGKNYGTFTDQRIIIDGQTVFVITSELRTRASERAGTLSFPEGDKDAAARFMRQQDVSAKFVRNAVGICSVGSAGC
jgi:hypothetical protein